MEERIVANESTLPYRALPAAAIRGRSPLVLAKNLGTLAVGTLAALALLRDMQPAVILGTGGYVCVPLFLAAKIRRIPTLLYLPDVVPGLAVQWLSHLSTQVACSVGDACTYFDSSDETKSRKRSLVSKVVAQVTRTHQDQPIVSGYPVRNELFTQDKAECRRLFSIADDLPVLLVYGGSRGARSINRAIQALLPHILAIAHILHICGREGDDVWLRETARQLSPSLQARYQLSTYLESRHVSKHHQNGNGYADEHNQTYTPSDSQTEVNHHTMVTAMGAADLALCRSGASVLGELPALGLPAILVPYPYVNQDKNANYLVRHGAAVAISDDTMLGNGHPVDGPLYRALERFLHTHAIERFEMAEKSRALARPDAAHCLAQALHSLAARGGNV